ncbi:hypothetical protein EDB85DRAFT_1403332 [Lactarius pseudohatsudake]|nr:hypothetical protein EDB85DRAFT_1403332 [Lactarius pseudohatsudake]
MPRSMKTVLIWCYRSLDRPPACEPTAMPNWGLKVGTPSTHCFNILQQVLLDSMHLSGIRTHYPTPFESIFQKRVKNTKFGCVLKKSLDFKALKLDSTSSRCGTVKRSTQDTPVLSPAGEITLFAVSNILSRTRPRSKRRVPALSARARPGPFPPHFTIPLFI